MTSKAFIGRLSQAKESEQSPIRRACKVYLGILIADQQVGDPRGRLDPNANGTEPTGLGTKRRFDGEALCGDAWLP